MTKKQGFRTLDEIRCCQKEFLVPTDVAPFLRCNAYSINMQAQENPALLGFPVVVINRRVKIPRQGFINFFEGRSHV